MHTYIKYTLLISLIFLLVSLLTANTIVVDINGTGNYTTIQEGINNASNGDIVLVYPGTYYENIDYAGKNITVASKYYTTGDEAYIDSTIIDGNNNGSCVLIFDSLTESKIYGFTLQHGSGFLESSGTSYGGGINLSYNLINTFYIYHCIIKNNTSDQGGGISNIGCENLYIIGTIIYNNHASILGGGIAKGSGDVEIIFSEQDRCDIYMNYSPMGSDIYNHTGNMTVSVGTFTVQEPDKFYVYSRNDSVTMNILNYKIEPINNDLYVKPDGDNSNSGLSWDEAYKNIYHALIMVKSDSLHPNTINVAEGFYSPSTTGEFFALGGKEYISIIGAGKDLTTLDAEQTSQLVLIKNVSVFSVQKMTLQHGYDTKTGGIYIQKNSNPIIKDIILIDNDVQEWGKVHISCDEYSNPIFENVNMKTTYSQVNSRAVRVSGNCTPLFINCSIEKNKTNPIIGNFGAMSCVTYATPIFINCMIVDNYGDICSGISSIYSGEDIYVINSTIVDNDNCSEGTIRLVYNSHITLINTILRNEPATEIWFHPMYDPNSATIEYCNIEGGSLAVAINNNGTLNWGEGNIDEDPMFVGGDPFSYELLSGSPCIDAGTPDTTGLNLPSTDLAGNPRIYNGRIDIGAYEWQGNAVDEPDTSFIHKLYLFQNTPNPFTNETEILFITTDYERVKDYTLSIYNVKGQLVRKYSGRNHNFWVKTKITWDGTDENGYEVAPGPYFYKLEYGDNAVVRKMILLSK